MKTVLSRRAGASLALATLLATALPRAGGASARNATDAGSFVTTLAQDAIDQLAAPNLSEGERDTRFRKLFLDGFDVPLIARFVLGRYWRQATEAERAEYLRLFDELVVQTYARRFNEFNTARLRVLSVSRPNEDNDVIVAVEGSVASKPPVRLDVRVRRGSSAYKVIDVSIEGVSMAVTQRDEFSSVIQRGGGKVEALLASLRGKVGAR
ncbi:MAG: ABC transporter substrate-binding protein [Alphaproteobacteria bacterium]|nr:ABC transporter substrate-binding protein [Alphaproteobacteria bacterium]